MIARKYNRQIKIYQTQSISDGYGGTLPSDVLIGTFWSEVSQNSAFRDNQVGSSDIKNNWSFKIRSTDKITPNNIDNLFIEYRNRKYVVNDIRYNDELFRFVNITANSNGKKFVESVVVPDIPIIDETPPTTPQNLTYDTNIIDPYNYDLRHFTIRWTGAQDLESGIIGYDININGSVIYYAFPLGTDPGFAVIKNKLPSTTYLVKIKARNSNNITGAYTNVISITTV